VTVENMRCAAAAQMGDNSQVVDGTAEVSDEELTEAIIVASRAMVAVATRSLAAADHDVTLPQYRTLVVLAYGGSKRLADLASHLSVSPSTATRMCDRLVRKGLVTRARDEIDRREVKLDLTEEGRNLVHQVMDRRREDVQTLLSAIPTGSRRALVASLQVLARAVGEAPDLHWAPGWPAGTDSADGAASPDGAVSSDGTAGVLT
jgi:DNA-binding MarR family transcriptional regulator